MMSGVVGASGRGGSEPLAEAMLGWSLMVVKGELDHRVSIWSLSIEAINLTRDRTREFLSIMSATSTRDAGVNNH